MKRRTPLPAGAIRCGRVRYERVAGEDLSQLEHRRRLRQTGPHRKMRVLQ